MSSKKMQIFISKIAKATLVLIFVVLINSCGMSMLASRDNNPVIQDFYQPEIFSSKAAGIFATTASRRLVVLSTNDAGLIMTCAEPSPDVGESVASAIAGGLQAAGSVSHETGAKISADLAAQYARTVATQIAPLLYRTQGLQLYRDSLYKLCIDRMNNWITQPEYDAERKDKFEKAAILIQAEFPYMEKALNTVNANVKAGDSKASLEDISKILEILKKDAISPPASASKGADAQKKDPILPTTVNLEDLVKIIEALKK
jgi:hypothetical protein